MAQSTAVAQQRPQLVQPTGQDEEKGTIRALLQAPQTMKRFKDIAPKHLNPERLLRVMAHAVYKTPKLGECQPMTLLGAMMVCASLGLEPNTVLGHAYLIPFEKREKRGSNWVTVGVDVNLIIGYRGYIDLARRSGSLVSIHADVVYGPGPNRQPPDEFSFEYGSNMHLRHVPIGDREGREAMWAYAHASLKDGQAFEVLPYARVLVIRNNSEGYKSALRQGKDKPAFLRSPWVAFEHEMAAKTMIRRLTKVLPLSIEFANAAALDAMSETGTVDLSSFADGVDLSTEDVGSAARQIEHSPEETVDSETGEITGGEQQRQPEQAQATQQQQQESDEHPAAEMARQQQQPAAGDKPKRGGFFNKE